MFSMLNDNADDIKFKLIRESNKFERKSCTQTFINSVKNINESVKSDIYSSIVSYMDFQKPIKSMMDNLSIVDNNNELLNFYEHLADSFNLGARPLTIVLKDTDAVSRIRSQYLVAYRRELDDMYKKAVLGNYNSTSEIKEKFKALEKKYKLSIVKTTLLPGALIDLKPIKPQTYVVNNDFVTNTICQFVRNYNTIREQLISETNENIDAINLLENSLKIMVDAAIPTQLSKEEQCLLEYFIHRSVQCTQKILTYTTAAVIERLSSYIYNMNTYYKLYNTICSIYPEGERILHENCIDADLDNLDDFKLFDYMIHNDTSFLIPAIQQSLDQIQFEIDHIMQYAKNDSALDNLMNSFDENSDYDKNPYNQVIGLLKTYNNCLRDMYESSKDPNMTVDEIVNKAGADCDFVDKFKTVISMIPDTTLYTSQLDDSENTPLLMLQMIKAELSHYAENLANISTSCQAVYNNIQMMKRQYEENNNTMFGSPEQAQELCDLAQSYEQNICDISTNILKAFVQRLKNLKNSLESLDYLQERVEIPYMITQEDNVSYIEEAYRSILDEDKYFEEAAFNSLLRQYNVYRNKVERGVVILYEADTPDNNTTNNSNNNNNNPTANNKTAMSGAWAKFKAFIKDIISKFKKKTKDIQASGKIDYINKNETTILDKITDDVTCTIQPYYPSVNIDLYEQDFKKFENNIKALTDNDIKNATSGDSLREKIYGFISTKTIGNYSMNDDFKNLCLAYYSSGSEYDDYRVGKTVEGSELKTAVQQEINFCKEYFATANSIANTCNRVIKALDQRLADLQMIDKEQVKKSEDEQNKNNNEQNKDNKDNDNQQNNNNQNNNSNNSNNNNNQNTNQQNETNNQQTNNSNSNNNTNNNQNNNNSNNNNTNNSNNNQNNNNQNINSSYYEPILSGAVIYEDGDNNQQTNNSNSNNNQNNNNSNNNNTNNSNNNQKTDSVSIEEKIGWLTADCRLFETAVMSAIEKRFFSDSKLFFNIVKGNVKKAKEKAEEVKDKVEDAISNTGDNSNNNSNNNDSDNKNNDNSNNSNNEQNNNQ